MTKEEAIKVLTVIKGSKEFIQGFGTKYNNDIEAIDMAIEALSADRPQGEDWDKYSEKLWRLAYERGKNDRPKGDPETEPAPVVAYICDRRRCAICRGKDGGCDHTTDIKHAAHFKNVAGQYFERPYMEEEEDGDL